jgi:hypothetical protein
MRTKRTRRTDEQKIKDLEAEIRRLKERAEQKRVRRDPALRHVAQAVRSIDQAMAATSDAATRKGLGDARATLGACLAMAGVDTKSRTKNAIPRRGVAAQVEPETVLSYVRNNPNSSGEHIADAMGTDTATLRPVMRQLIETGQVKTTGKGRGMRYGPA